ncbi:unnamed protein product [Moneuplotes crassus]|uniref:Uncharacterized protein n=1 Tax=Euplotes crassus TaxID=5936 RepID=A0AAD1U1F0_EUPCR|nr:unnamed protein product [Moneuplotes crassus]
MSSPPKTPPELPPFITSILPTPISKPTGSESEKEFATNPSKYTHEEWQSMNLFILQKSIMDALDKAFTDKNYCVTKGKMDKFHFCRVVLETVEIKEYEKKIFLINAITQLFGGRETIEKVDVANYFIDNVIHIDEKLKNSEQKYVYKGLEKTFPALYFSKELDSFSPLVYGNSDQIIRRFEKDKIILNRVFERSKILFIEREQRIIGCEVDCSGFKVYTPKGKLEKSVDLEQANHLKYTKTMCIAYSSFENRIGAVNNDHTLSFWDIQDNCKFEKVIHSKKKTLEDQIYYIKHIGTWLTIDQESNLYLWNLEEETSEALIKKHKGTVLAFQEIIHQRMVVFSTLQKQLVFWNLTLKVCTQIINLENVSIHTMCFLPDYKLLATSNFGNIMKKTDPYLSSKCNVILWRFIDQDISKVGELLGHTSQIVAVDYLMNSPALITCDDTGVIKTWDIRSCQCVQTYTSDSKIVIHKFLNIDENTFIGISKRCLWFTYEESDEQRKICKMIFEYNADSNELYVGTRTNIRCVDLHSGKTTRVLANVVEKGEEITKICLHSDKANLLVGTSTGAIKLISTLDGSFRKKLFSHKKDVCSIVTDSKNGLIISAGIDSKIMVQGEKFEKPLRVQKRAHSTFEITECRIKYNLLATSADSMILIWNYDNFQLRGICFYQRNNIRRFEFLDDHLVLISIDSNGNLIGWDLRTSNTFNYYYKPLFKVLLKPENGANLMVNNMMIFKIEKDRLLDQSYDLTDQNFIKFYKRFQRIVKRSATLINIHSFQSKKVEQKKEVELIYLCTDNGRIFCCDLNIILNSMNLEKGHLKEKPFNAFMKCYSPYNEWFKDKNQVFKVLEKISDGVDQSPQSPNSKSDDKSMKIPPVRVIEEQTVFSTLNTNLTMEDDLFPHFSWRAHNGSASAMQLIKLPKEYIVIGAEDKHIITIFSLFGKLQCIYNLEFPLPTLWTLSVSSLERRKEQFEAAALLLDQIELFHKLKGTKKAKFNFSSKRASENTSQILDEYGDNTVVVNLKKVPKMSANVQQVRKSQGVLTFEELLTKVDSEVANGFEPCTFSLRKIDAKNRKLFEEPPKKDYLNDSNTNIRFPEEPYDQLFDEKEDKSKVNKPSENPNLTDREKLQLFVKEVGDQGLLNEFLPTNYLPAREMKKIMEYYQYTLAKDFLKLKRSLSKDKIDKQTVKELRILTDYEIDEEDSDFDDKEPKKSTRSPFIQGLGEDASQTTRDRMKRMNIIKKKKKFELFKKNRHKGSLPNLRDPVPSFAPAPNSVNKMLTRHAFFTRQVRRKRKSVPKEPAKRNPPKAKMINLGEDAFDVHNKLLMKFFTRLANPTTRQEKFTIVKKIKDIYDRDRKRRGNQKKEFIKFDIKSFPKSKDTKPMTRFEARTINLA